MGRGLLKYHQCGIGLYTEQFRFYPSRGYRGCHGDRLPLVWPLERAGGELAAATQKSDFIRAIES